MEAKGYNLCVHNWADALFRFACKCTGNAEDAHDVVQNCFEVLWQKRNEVQEDSAKAFLFQVAYNQSVDLFRKQARYSAAAMPEVTFTPVNPDLKHILDRALARLSEESRALVLLKDQEGYSYDEIAGITGLSGAQVKVYLHRARKLLKDYLVGIEHIL